MAHPAICKRCSRMSGEERTTTLSIRSRAARSKAPLKSSGPFIGSECSVNSGRTCGGLCGEKLEFADIGIPDHAQTGKRWRGFFQEFDLFAAKLGKIEEQSRKIASRMAKALDPSSRHWIAFQVYSDDRGRDRRPHHSLERILRPSDNHIALKIDQFLGKVRKSIERCFINSGLNKCILTVNVPSIVQPPHERHYIFIPDSLEETNSGEPASELLCARDERPSGRRAS